MVDVKKNTASRFPEYYQDTEAFDRQINEKNVWFRPHIKYSSFKKGPDYTFSEKIQLQNALNKITKISMIANNICDVSVLPFRIKTSNTLLDIIDAEFVRYLDTMFSKTSIIITINDLRDPVNPELVNKSHHEMSICACNILYGKAGLSIYIGSDFFRLGITLEQRAIILYYNFVKLATYTMG